MFAIRLKIKASGETEKTDWTQAKDKWAPQEKDPPHVNFMKKAEITNSDGKFYIPFQCCGNALYFVVVVAVELL